MCYRFAILAAAVAVQAATAVAQPTTMPATAPATAPSTVVAVPPVERATNDAVARLYTKIAAERVNGQPLGQILDRAEARPRVMVGLADAEQIGGPREIDDGIVQVTLEIRGDRAAQIIVDSLNAADPARVSVPPKILAQAMRRWNERAFRATGDSQGGDSAAPTSVAAAVELPDQAPEWAREAHTASAVAPDAGYQLRTARQAEKSARDALRADLVKLQIDAKRRLGQTSSQTIDAIVAAARIAGVDYRPDGSVEVRVTIDGQQIWQTLQQRSVDPRRR